MSSSDIASETSARIGSGKVSAVSYVLEPPGLFAEHGWAGYEAPSLVSDKDGGQAYSAPGLAAPVALATLVAAGRPKTSYRRTGLAWRDIPQGAWDPVARLKAMGEDSVATQVLYPLMALHLLSVADVDYQEKAFAVSNDLVRSFVQADPAVFAGVRMIPFRSPHYVVQELWDAREQGFVGAVLPSVPPNIDLDYHHREWDRVWDAAVELGMPLTFHAQATPEYGLLDGIGHRVRNLVHGYLNLTRNPQQLINLFIGSGIFDRHPGLQVVVAEGDASWAPHLGVRLRHWESIHGIRRTLAEDIPVVEGHHPDDYLWENVWYAITDDTPALRMKTEFGPRPHLLWADSYPTPESDWPNSDEYLNAEPSTLLTAAELEAFTGAATTGLYRLPQPAEK